MGGFAPLALELLAEFVEGEFGVGAAGGIGAEGGE